MLDAALLLTFPATPHQRSQQKRMADPTLLASPATPHQRSQQKRMVDAALLLTFPATPHQRSQQKRMVDAALLLTVPATPHQRSQQKRVLDAALLLTFPATPHQRSQQKRVLDATLLLTFPATPHQRGQQERVLDAALLALFAASRKRSEQQGFQGSSFSLGRLGTLGLCGSGHGIFLSSRVREGDASVSIPEAHEMYSQRNAQENQTYRPSRRLPACRTRYLPARAREDLDLYITADRREFDLLPSLSCDDKPQEAQ
ncbi:hypothetical protein [Thermoactinospora rubra]|uniref:hypothetical protein n=1 Tax=Thermoactinospora rubra TaxID=1088767 RepID=UPI00117CD5DE|nr:hypothetical protein [Thermoactinospora rubra]